MTGRIFQVQRFCTHDGPGVRTTVFLKGCGLRCQWCHNPEGLSYELQWMQDERKCISCGRCREGERKNCPTGAWKIAGQDMESHDLLPLLLRDKPFYGDEGGVTFSGGECMLQADFVAEVMALLQREGVSSIVDTAGFVPFSAYEKVLPYCRHFLFDVKMVDDEKHRRFTGQGNGMILENLCRLSQAGARLWIRIPVIGGINDEAAEMRAIGAMLRSLPHAPEKVELLPYHDMGRGKCGQLGMKYPLEVPHPFVTDEWIHELSKALEETKMVN